MIEQPPVAHSLSISPDLHSTLHLRMHPHLGLLGPAAPARQTSVATSEEEEEDDDDNPFGDRMSL